MKGRTVGVIHKGETCVKGVIVKVGCSMEWNKNDLHSGCGIMRGIIQDGDDSEKCGSWYASLFLYIFRLYLEDIKMIIWYLFVQFSSKLKQRRPTHERVNSVCGRQKRAGFQDIESADRGTIDTYAEIFVNLLRGPRALRASSTHYDHEERERRWNAAARRNPNVFRRFFRHFFVFLPKKLVMVTNGTCAQVIWVQCKQGSAFYTRVICQTLIYDPYRNYITKERRPNANEHAYVCVLCRSTRVCECFSIVARTKYIFAPLPLLAWFLFVWWCSVIYTVYIYRPHSMFSTTWFFVILLPKRCF